MTIKAYLYNSCTSCRKTDEMLKDSGVNYERREYFKDRFTKDELKEVLHGARLSVRDVLSTRSTPYKQHDLANRHLSDDELLDLMVEDPRLLRRPLVIGGDDQVVNGHNAARLQAIIDSQR